MPLRLVLLSALALGLAVPPSAFCQDKSGLATSLRELGPLVDPKGDFGKLLPQLLGRDQRARREAIHKADNAAWHALKSKEDWEAFKKPRIDALRKSLGQWHDPPRDLKVQVTKTIAGDGFFIDNLVFESRPNLLVTANLYRPAKPGEKMPGFLICHSHHNPKTEGELQDMGMTWARAGCMVLVMDQLGHGERRTHPFTDAKQYPEAFKAGRQDYYFRYNVANQLELVGESLIGWMAWDMMRGVDLLLSKPGIDKNRIILLGAVAGGGDPVAVTAALDERIACVCPFNFGGPQPESPYPLPADAETSFNYLGSGGWESTRNLRQSGSGGFAPWVIVASIAPRKLIYGHEFSWDRAGDPVWKRLEKVYGWYGAADSLAFTTGKGKLSGKAPESTHCNNIGPEHRVGIHAALNRWYGMPIPQEYSKRIPSADLKCLTPEIAQKMLPLHEVIGRLAETRLKAAARARGQLSAEDQLLQVRKAWTGLLGDTEPYTGLEVKRTEIGKVATFTAQFCTAAIAAPGAEPRGYLTYLKLLPRSYRVGSPCVVMVAQDGAAALLQKRAEAIAGLLDAGFVVCLPDLCGCGVQRIPGDSRGRGSSSTSLSSTEQMLGQTMLGQRLRDLRTVIALETPRVEGKPGALFLWGESLAQPNAADTKLGVPLELKQPQHAEPLGATAAVLAALYEPGVKMVYARGGLSRFASAYASPFLHLPHDSLVPGALTVCDLPDLAALLAPRPVRLEAQVDGLNRRVDDRAVSSDAEVIRLFVEQLKKG